MQLLFIFYVLLFSLTSQTQSDFHETLVPISYTHSNPNFTNDVNNFKKISSFGKFFYPRYFKKVHDRNDVTLHFPKAFSRPKFRDTSEPRVIHSFSNRRVAQVFSSSYGNLFYEKTAHVSLNSPYSMKHVCYYAIPNQDSWDKTLRPLDPQIIDPWICTHIIIAFARVIDEKIVPKNESHFEIFEKVKKLRLKNANLKVMISIGGDFQTLVKKTKSIDIFAYNARTFLQENNLDGLDLDWEFPAWPVKISNAYEKSRFTYLLTQLSNSLRLASHPPFELSIAVAAPKTIVDRSYEVEEIVQNVDFISIMGYDFHLYKNYFPFTGHNSPLYKAKNDVGYFATLNIEWAAKYWAEKGAPKEKLIVGIPTYGRTWKLFSPRWKKVGALAVGEGLFSGYVSYLDVLDLLEKGAEAHFDEYSHSPYLTYGRNWISYDNIDSTVSKAKYIKDNAYAGVMTWNLNNDYFSYDDPQNNFPLHKAILNA